MWDGVAIDWDAIGLRQEINDFWSEVFDIDVELLFFVSVLSGCQLRCRRHVSGLVSVPHLKTVSPDYFYPWPEQLCQDPLRVQIDLESVET